MTEEKMVHDMGNLLAIALGMVQSAQKQLLAENADLNTTRDRIEKGLDALNKMKALLKERKNELLRNET